MSIRSLPVVFSAAVFGFMPGCASIITGSDQAVSFNSDPSGAQVQLVTPEDEVLHSGTTPFTVNLDKGRGYFKAADLTMRVNHQGQSRDIPLNQDLSLWYLIGNLGFGGLIGWFVVDPLTGAAYKFPKTVNVSHLDAEGDVRPEYADVEEEIEEDVEDGEE